MAAYRLAPDICRGFFRLFKEWPEETPQPLRRLTLRLGRRWRMIPCGESFFCLPGDAPMDVPFRHPVTGTTHTLHIRDCSVTPVVWPERTPEHDEADDEIAGTLRVIPTPEDLAFPGNSLRLICSIEPSVPEGGRVYIRSNVLQNYAGYSVQMDAGPAIWSAYMQPKQASNTGQEGEWFLCVNTKPGPRQTVALEI